MLQKPCFRLRAGSLLRFPTRQRGVTLIETLTAVGIVSVGVSIAVPSLTSVLEDGAITTRANLFVAGLQYARGMAVREGAEVVVCPSTDGRSCTHSAGGHTDWSSGFLVFADRDRDLAPGPDEVLLHQAFASNSVRALSSAGRPRVVYQPSGFAGGTNGRFTICSARRPQATRTVVVSNTGRPRTSGRAADHLPCPS